MRRSLWSAVVALGCGHPAPTTAPTPIVAHTADAGVDSAPVARTLADDLQRLAERSVAMYRDLLHALDATGTDCAAATAQLNAVIDKYADIIAANAMIAHQGHDKITQLRAALEPHRDELDANAKAISDAITKSNCAANADFAKAFDRLGEPG